MDAVKTLSNLVSERWLVFLTGSIVVAASLSAPSLIAQLRLWSIPLVGSELGGHAKRQQAFLGGARALYNEGHRKFKEGVYRITTSRESTTILVLSPKFLPELNRLPDKVVSMAAAADESLETKYTQIQTNVPIIPHTIKTQLTPSLPKLNAAMAQEVREAIDLEMPPCADWTEIDIHHVLLRVVAMASGCVFIGPKLCRNEQYLDSAINYTMEAIGAQRAVQQLRPWQRPFLASNLHEVKRLQQRIQEAKDFMQPVVDSRREAAKDPSYEKPSDMLQWLMDDQHKFKDSNSQDLAKVLLLLNFAAIHTTSLTATNAFYDIAALPDFIHELREEIEKALAENGGEFTSNALQSMKRMDSFMKETLRLYPANMASFQRKVLQPFTLSNGQYIPTGTMIEVAAVAAHSDSEVFPEASKFDPLRFFKLRENAKFQGSGEGAALNQFVSVSQSSLTFGYGRHACPGRFLAANEIKMILAEVLLKYDFKLTEGSEGRYPNLEFSSMSIPDPSKRLLCKKRSL